MSALLGAVGRDGTTDEFLDAARRGEFLLRACRNCDQTSGPQESQCPRCGSTDTGWTPAGGGARIVSWSVVHARNADGTTTPGTVTVIAELDEGPWWWSQLTGADPAELATGRRLRIAFAPAEGGETLPVFELA
jgi:uncharacterized OB-fold protein